MAKEMTREIIERINIGDGITNPELDAALTFYKDLSDKLRLLGPEFKLMRNEIYATLERLKGFKAARERA